MLQQIIDSRVDNGTRAYLWLSRGQHGIEWLYARSKNLPKREQEHQLRIIQRVVDALEGLPSPEKPERLALFAQRISGDPHALDTNTGAGRLFLQALGDLVNMTWHDEHEDREGQEGQEEVVPPSQDRMGELRLYESVGLRVDTISSYVAAFQLLEALDSKGQVDEMLQKATNRVLLLPLRQIVEWQAVTPTKHAIYVYENPQVFEELVEQQQGKYTSPTLICTSGWPSVAALQLLHLLLEQSADNMLYYSGDFDIKGLQIAAYLLARYGGRCRLCHFDSNAYEVALQNGGVAATANELAMLSTLPAEFAALVHAMQKHGMWAYQEGITQLLAADLANA